MGKFLERWLPITVLWLMIVVFVARPEIPAAIHNVIERWRWSKYQSPVPTSVPMPRFKFEPRQPPANGFIEC